MLILATLVATMFTACSTKIGRAGCCTPVDGREQHGDGIRQTAPGNG